MYNYEVSQLSVKIECCRVCGHNRLKTIFDFGDMSLTGVFLEDGNDVPRAQLILKRCEACGLVQLGNDYEQSALYGSSYGYESHLNSSMQSHLRSKARMLETKYLSTKNTPLVVDIASNDGTLLSGFKSRSTIKIGIDPLIDVVADFYPEGSIKSAEFFSSETFLKLGTKKADLVTSLSVVYDLRNPIEFATQIYEILSDEGVWHFEQSYLPLMLETGSYDTICHEHLLYLSLADIQNILIASNFQILDVSLNSVNGGSIAVTAVKSKELITASPFIEFLLRKEKSLGITDGSSVDLFASKIRNHATELRELLSTYKNRGYRVAGIGASTKGNVLLQAAELDSSLISAIGEVNPRKFGRQTPGSSIQIIPESAILTEDAKKTLILVLPWHFRDSLLPKFEDFIKEGGTVMFPLPRIEIVA